MTSNNRLMLCKIAGMQRTRSISRFRKVFNPSPIYSKSRVKRFKNSRKNSEPQKHARMRKTILVPTCKTSLWQKIVALAP
jgi:hypothetical protein